MSILIFYPISLSLLLLLSQRGAASIGCFVCSSFNGSNPACEDPFNSSLTAPLQEKEESRVNFHHPCWAYKKDRNGLFPADHCIKINGGYAKRGSAYRSYIKVAHHQYPLGFQITSQGPNFRTIWGTFGNSKRVIFIGRQLDIVVGDRGSMLIRTCALDSGSLTADTEIVRISHCGHFKYENASYSGCVQSCDSDGCNSVERAALLPFLFSIPLLFIHLYTSFSF